MSSEQIAIRAENLSKCYQIYARPKDRLKQSIYPRLNRLMGRPAQNYFREFWALRSVSFRIGRGETVGIVGRNGAGKSTLLQLLCGTLSPTSGQVEVNGRVAALLELGSGFNPEFSGRENVYLNASVLGLTREQIDARFDRIAGFADIGEFIEQPVKTYSSGMYVRLAFSVAAHVDADILVVDEALSVGDVFFQQKCMRYLRGFKEQGGSLLFVSHDTAAVMALCDRAILLKKDRDGHAFQEGGVEEICRNYLQDLYRDDSRAEAVRAFDRQPPTPDAPARPSNELVLGDMSQVCRYMVSSFNPHADAFGERAGTIEASEFRDRNGAPLSLLQGDQDVTLAVRIRAEAPIRWPAVGVILKDRQGQFVFTESTDPHFRGMDLSMTPGDRAEVLFDFKMPCLLRGNYTLDIAFANGMGDDHVQQHWMHDVLRIECIEGRHVHGIVGFPELKIAWRR